MACHPYKIWAPTTSSIVTADILITEGVTAMENLRLFVFHEKRFQLNAWHWDRRGIAVACVCPFVRLVRLSRSPSKHVCVITLEIISNHFCNLAEILVLEIIWEVRLWIFQVTKYVHNGPKSDFDIFGIPKVVLQVRAFKFWSFT